MFQIKFFDNGRKVLLLLQRYSLSVDHILIAEENHSMFRTFEETNLVVLLRFLTGGRGNGVHIQGCTVAYAAYISGSDKTPKLQDR